MTIDLNELPPELAAVLRLAHRARKLSEVWGEHSSRKLLAEKLLADFEKLKAEPTNWPPMEEQLFAWRFPDTPEEMSRNSLIAVALGLETLAHAQLLHAELLGSWGPATMELDLPVPPAQEPGEASRPTRPFRRVGKPGSKWAGVL